MQDLMIDGSMMWGMGFGGWLGLWRLFWSCLPPPSSNTFSPVEMSAWSTRAPRIVKSMSLRRAQRRDPTGSVLLRLT